MQNIVQALSARVDVLTEYLYENNIHYTRLSNGEITIYIPSGVQDDTQNIENYIHESRAEIENLYFRLGMAYQFTLSVHNDAITITGNPAHDPDHLMQQGRDAYEEYLVL